MEGFLNIRLRPWLRRLITRGIAIVPAVITAIMYGESGTAKLLVLSQVILSLQLSFAVFPLVMFTSDRAKMGEFVNPLWVKGLAYLGRVRHRVAERVAAFPDIPRLAGLMYKRILVPVENSRYDAAIIEHVRGLAKLMRRLGGPDPRSRRVRRAEREAARAARVRGDAPRPGLPRASSRRSWPATASMRTASWRAASRRRRSPRRRSGRSAT